NGCHLRSCRVAARHAACSCCPGMNGCKQFMVSLCFVAGAAFAAGCTVSEDGGSTGGGVGSGGADAGAGGAAACTPANIQATVFARCTGGGGHDAAGPAAGLELAAAGVANRGVGITSTCLSRPLVAAGDPAGSYLLEKLSGAPSCGEPMPAGGAAPLSADEFN